ncbi:hypothetical protein HK405_010628 [Cladochytrium tenue]|nr:hypothetical protein HK405_010628 [Cladochytrium tenue]
MSNASAPASVVGRKGVTVRDFQSTGRGLCAARPFRSGEVVLRCPRDLLWSVEAAAREPVLGEILSAKGTHLSTDDTLVVFLLFVKHSPRCHQPPDSPRRTHIATGVPTRYTASVFFSRDDLAVCAGSSLHFTTLRLLGQIAEDYRDLVAGLFAIHPEVFPLDRFTLDEYKWALFSVWSRAMDFHTPDGMHVRAIAPFLDLANHSFDVPQCHAYDPSTGSIQIMAGKDYRKGDQIFINYGPVGNAKLLRLYGFVMPQNPHDTYDLVLYTDPSAPMYEAKLNFFRLVGLDAHVTIPMSLADPLPASVLQYLRIQRMSPSDVEKAVAASSSADSSTPAVASRRLSAESEREILAALEDSFSELLAQFTHSADVLEARIADGTYAAGTDAFGAATVALSEQQILAAARNRVRALLRLVVCACCGKTDESAKRCARCGNVVYCDRECQVKDWPSHKQACKTTTTGN